MRCTAQFSQLGCRQAWQAAGTSVSPKCATSMIWPPGVSLGLGWLRILSLCCWQGALLHAEACQHPCIIKFSLSPGLLSYGMTLAWRLKPARPGCLAFDSNRGLCVHSAEALRPQNLCLSLSEMQREDCGMTLSHGIFSSSWSSCFEVCPGSQAVLAGASKAVGLFPVTRTALSAVALLTGDGRIAGGV